MYFRYFVIISLEKGPDSPFEQTLIPFNQGCFVPSLVEIGPLFWRRRFLNYLPLEKDGTLHLNKLESSTPKDALCQVWLKLVQSFWRSKMKIWKVYRQTDRRTNDGWQVIRKAHLSFQLRWAKKKQYNHYKVFSCEWKTLIRNRGKTTCSETSFWEHNKNDWCFPLHFFYSKDSLNIVPTKYFVDRIVGWQGTVKDGKLSFKPLWNVISTPTRMYHSSDKLHIYNGYEISRLVKAKHTMHLHHLSCDFICNLELKLSE